MSRCLSQHSLCQPLAELTRQLLVAPSTKRIEQVRCAEKLYDDIDPDLNYPYEFVCFRITGYRSELESSVIVGDALLADLRLLIDMLSRSVGMPPRAREPVQTPQELARSMNVSTKTVERWRKLGLRWRWSASESGGRKKLVFTRSAVDHFLHNHGDRVDRARRFSKMDDQVRRRLLDRARQLAGQRETSPYRVARTLARESDRAVETIRLLLEQHDRDHPGEKIFENHTGPLSSRQKQVIQRAYRKGIPVGRIAARFRRTSATIHRVIRERRAASLIQRPITFVASPMFERDDADEVLLRDEPDPSTTPPDAAVTAALESVPAPLAALYARDPMPGPHQRMLVVKMNYLKHKALQYRDRLNRNNPNVSMMNRVEQWLDEAHDIRHRLILANLPRTLVVTRQHLSQSGEKSSGHLVDLLALAMRELIDVVDGFDFTEHESLESFLNWSLVRCFARYEPPRQARRRLSDEEMVTTLREAGRRMELGI